MKRGSVHVEILVELGLALSEAKVFCALSQDGPSTAKTIAKASGVAREAVYQIIPKLEEKGLIEVILSSPKMFKAIPKQEAYDVLFEKWQEESNRLKAKIRKAFCEAEDISPANVLDQSETVLVPAGKVQHRMLIAECKNSQDHVDFIMPRDGFVKWCRLFAKEEAKISRKKGIRIRVITVNSQENGASSIEPPSALSDGLDQVDIRYLGHAPTVSIAVFDTRTVVIATQPNKKVLETPVLWSTNPGVVEMATSYFEKLWATSKIG